MRIPDLPPFAKEIGQIFDKIKNMKIDENLYKPSNIFGTVDPNLFSVSICTVDGQVSQKCEFFGKGILKSCIEISFFFYFHFFFVKLSRKPYFSGR